MMEDAAEQLDRLAESVGECARCGDLVARRLRVVAGGGHPHCDVMVVALAPDPADEEEGRLAGTAVVDRLAEFMPALATSEQKVYQTALLKCVTRDDLGLRPPSDEELDNCFPYLSREISITTPHFILTIGERTSRYVLSRLFKDRPYREADSLELRVFDNPAFKVIPIAEPHELQNRGPEERRNYVESLGALARMMGLQSAD